MWEAQLCAKVPTRLAPCASCLQWHTCSWLHEGFEGRALAASNPAVAESSAGAPLDCPVSWSLGLKMAQTSHKGRGEGRLMSVVLTTQQLVSRDWGEGQRQL